MIHVCPQCNTTFRGEEVWRELPETVSDGQDLYQLVLMKTLGKNICGYVCCGKWLSPIGNIDPTDALIELRIWLEERKEIKNG